MEKFKNKKEIETRFKEILLERIDTNKYSENEYLIKILLNLEVDNLAELMDDVYAIDGIYEIWDKEYNFKKGLGVGFEKKDSNYWRIYFEEDSYDCYYDDGSFIYEKDKEII